MKHDNHTFQLPNTFQPETATLVDFIVLPYKTERKSGKYVHQEKHNSISRKSFLNIPLMGYCFKHVDKHLDHITN